MTEILSQRGLNRATLARQHLLQRAPARAIDVIEHLAGMQSQAPLARGQLGKRAAIRAARLPIPLVRQHRIRNGEGKPVTGL